MPASTAAHTAAHETHESLKDTIESIVVALILAFVFRAFIVEAFVIPTGSMAPTLYGAHGTILCQDCGVEFAYGLRDLDDHRKGQPVLATSEAVCPNCAHPNTDLRVNDEVRNPDKGDRILVLKWPFDIDGAWFGPQRWDVVVFKDPSDGVTNFIKRLVGLPHEVLMILDGDVYTVPVGDLSDDARRELEQYVMRKHAFASGKSHRGALETPGTATMRELDEKMTIAQKTSEAQQTLWLPVYNHDYPPRHLDPYQPRWSPRLRDASGWHVAGRRVQFNDRAHPDDYIELKGKQIRADNAYNVYDGGEPPFVQDLRVSFVCTPRDAEAVVHVRLEKRKRVFWATFAADGTLALSAGPKLPVNNDAARAVAKLQPFTPGQGVELAFENVDYHLALSVGGAEVLASSFDPEDAAYYGPNVEALWLAEQNYGRPRRRPRPPDPPRLYGAGAFDVIHLNVERDVYYYHNERFAAFRDEPWAPTAGWGSAASPILLREHEFFMLGDNTAASKDSRLWDQPGPHLLTRGPDFQLGTVPRDQLIGKAFFVYWPSGHRLKWLPVPMLDRIGVIPDVGRMRWIR